MILYQEGFISGLERMSINMYFQQLWLYHDDDDDEEDDDDDDNDDEDDEDIDDDDDVSLVLTSQYRAPENCSG